MRTPQQIRNEVKKGCGDKYIGLGLECGNKRSFNNERIYYCPICLAKLSILTEYDKAMKEMIKRFFDGNIPYYEKNDAKIENGKEIRSRTYLGLSYEQKDILKRELLSKIGDNSQENKSIIPVAGKLVTKGSPDTSKIRDNSEVEK
jgi:hypothetical protein